MIKRNHIRSRRTSDTTNKGLQNEKKLVQFFTDMEKERKKCELMKVYKCHSSSIERERD